MGEADEDKTAKQHKNFIIQLNCTHVLNTSATLHVITPHIKCSSLKTHSFQAYLLEHLG